MKKQFDIITIGGATQDIMYYTNNAQIVKNKLDISAPELLAFVYGSKINSDDVHITFGGGAMNTAVNFSNLGLRTSTFINLGSDWFADAILKEIKNKNIDISNITKTEKIHSGFSFIINYGNYNEHIIFTYRGANSNLQISKQKLENINSKWIYIASLSGKDKLTKTNIDNVFKVAKNKKMKVAWNPGASQLSYGYKFFKKYLNQTETFHVNKKEAVDLVATSKIKTDNIETLLKIIHSWGPRICIITNGHRGAHVYDGEKFYYKKAKSHKSKNTTGAGDAFNSSFISGLILYNYNIKKSMSLAMLISANVVGNIGAQVGLIKKDKIKL